MNLMVKESTIEKLIDNISEIDGIFQITREIQLYLNNLNNIDLLPRKFKISRLHDNIERIIFKDKKTILIASKKIEKNEIISYSSGSKINLPLKYSRQINDNTYIIGTGSIKHSCYEPTCSVDPFTDNLIARQDIGIGQIISFNFLTSEFDLYNKIDCDCNEDNYSHKIQGFKHIGTEDRLRLLLKFNIAQYLLKHIYD